MRISGKTEREPLNTITVFEDRCTGPKTMTLDGEVYTCLRCTDPGCPVHGLEAVMLRTRQYIAEPSPEEPIVWRGRE